MNRRGFLRAGATAAGVATIGSASAQSSAISAVADLGLDPSGSEPINNALDDIPAGRVEFPGDGVFRLTNRVVLRPPGPAQIVGNGATLKLDSGVTERAFNCPNLPNGSLIQGFTIDQSAPGAVSGIRVGTEGTVEVRDVTLKGYAEPLAEGGVPGVLMPIARNPNAVVRITNFTAIGGTAAGMHSDGSLPPDAPANRLGTPMGMWVGQNNKGTVQLVNAKMRGWQNGTYAGRTPGRVEIRGGVFYNNSNTQIRVGGNSLIDGATVLLDDRQWKKNPNPGPYELGGIHGVNGIRVETGGSKGVQDAPCTIRNCSIRGLSMGKVGGLIDLEGSAPKTIVENTQIENHVDAPHLRAEAPGSQGRYAAAPLTAVRINHSVLSGGRPGTAIAVEDRPQSSVANTCLTIPDASADDIQGVPVDPSVSFGSCKSGFGLSNPKRVGSGANVSALPAPSAASGSSASAAARQQVFQQVAVVLQQTVFAVLFVVALVGMLALLPLYFLWKLLK